MKTRIVIGSFVLTLMFFQAIAQENDDMYFNSKDRQKQKVESVATPNVNQKIDDDYNAFRKKHFDKDEEQNVAADTLNPTDSYSARSINPEYISRSNSEQVSEDEQNYYVEGYAAPAYDSYSSGNNMDYNNLNGNNGYYNNPYSYNSPYNYYNPNNSYYPSSSFYSPYGYGGCNPWMSPYTTPGLTLSMSYAWGSPYYYSPYGYSGYHSPYYSGFGYPTYYYGGTESSRTNYGKRPSRNTAVVVPTRRRPEREVTTTTTTSGRTSSRTRPAVDEYYVKPYKRPVSSSNYTSGSYSRDQYARPSSTDRNRYSGNTSRDSRPSYSAPSRSRESSGSSAPTRSSSSGSRSRGGRD